MIAISQFSGKCDCYDHFSEYTDEQLQKSQIFIGDQIVPLRINNQHDLAPYYAHIVGSVGYCDGIAVCRLTERAYVDYEEEDQLTWKLRDIKKYYRKCKRNKIIYTVEEALKKTCFLTPTETDYELAKRVEIYGNKASIEGLHDSMHDYYRNELLEEMLRLGWDKRKAKYWLWRDWKMLIEEEDIDGSDTSKHEIKH